MLKTVALFLILYRNCCVTEDVIANTKSPYRTDFIN